jgi:alanyl-tRNA synthetase
MRRLVTRAGRIQAMTELAATERLYRTDSYAREMTATVLDSKAVDGNLELILDRTIFYPTAGGQSNDLGVLEGRKVLDVRGLKSETTVVHVLEGETLLEIGSKVYGTIDWQRRFDLMQQHTGEHILGQAFYRLEAHVIAVNMEREVCTLDLEQTITEAMALEAELAANQAIWAGHEIRCYEVHDSEISSVPLRRTPKVSGMIRVVQIGDYDFSACGGTHLKNSSEVGMVKILKLERIKGGATRVHFICGERCLMDYRFKHEFAAALGLKYSTGVENVPARTEAMLEELTQTKRDLGNLRSRLVELQASAWIAELGPVVARELEDANLMSELVKTFAAKPGTVGIFGARLDGRAMLAVAVGSGANANAGELLKIGLEHVEGRGGGKPDMAQGSGTKPEGLTAALEAMRQACG